MSATLTRRRFIRVTGAGVASAAFLGCGSSSPSSGGSGSGEGDLEMWAFSQERVTWLESVLADPVWKQSHAKSKVNIRVFPYEEMHDKLAAALVSGKGAPDLADVEISRFSPFIKGERVPFVALNDRIGGELDNVFRPAATDPWTWQDQIYGLCNELNTAVLAYRTDFMEQAGVKTPFATWDDVIAAGKEISTGERKMFAVHAPNFGDWYMMAQFAGGGFFDENGEYAADQPKSVEAMQFLQDLVHKDKIASVAPSLAGDDWFPPQYRAAFRADRYAAVWGPPWHLSFLLNDVPEQSGKWAVQKVPSGVGDGNPTANLGGTGMVITSSSKQQDLAFEFIRTANLTKEGALLDFKGRGAYPAYEPAYDEPALQQPNEYFGDAKLAQLYAELAPELPPFYQAPSFTEAQLAMNRLVITPVMRNQKTPEQAFAEHRKTVEEAAQG